MIKSIKVRLKPTKEQEELMWKAAGTMRFIYNWALARQQDNYKNGGRFIPDNYLRKEITQLKKTDEFTWLNEISNNVAKQAVKDACNSYKSFFKHQNGFPKFKSKKRSKPSFYNANDKLKVKTKLVLLEKIGWLKTSEQIPIGVKYMNPRISYDNKYWYISIGIEQENNIQRLTNESMGIDLGIKDLAICSNEMKFKNINKTKRVKRIKKKLKRLQKQVSRKYENNKIKIGGENRYQYNKTNNIKKLEKQIKLVYRKLSMIRKNHIHQATNKIVKTKPSRIVMEGLNVKGMMKNKHLAKAIAEQCFYEFIRQIKYKCEFNGIEFIQADRFYPSSKTCSECGSIKKDLKLSDRVYICEECGCIIDRDFNASVNLSRYSA